MGGAVHDGVSVLILCESGELNATSGDVGDRFAEHGSESTTADLKGFLAKAVETTP